MSTSRLHRHVAADAQGICVLFYCQSVVHYLSATDNMSGLYYEDDDPNHPDHWYDFIIKKDEEKARDNKYIFTCNSLAAHELGKTGFNIELDTELENNMGTVQELGEKVLKDSDWQLAAQG